VQTYRELAAVGYFALAVAPMPFYITPYNIPEIKPIRNVRLYNPIIIHEPIIAIFNVELKSLKYIIIPSVLIL
jgi:hypothetical protein